MKLFARLQNNCTTESVIDKNTFGNFISDQDGVLYFSIKQKILTVHKKNLFIGGFKVFWPVATPCDGEDWHPSGSNQVLVKKNTNF